MSKLGFEMDLNKRIQEMMALLAEYMQKTDRLLDRMDKHDILFEKQFARMDVAYQVIVAHSEKIDVLQQRANETQEELKVAALKQEARNEALMSEILAISKRVQTIESKH